MKIRPGGKVHGASIVKSFKASLRRNLPKMSATSKAERLAILWAYCTVIEANFLQWLAIAASRANTLVGRDTAMENLKCEVNEGHLEMLRRISSRLVGFDEEKIAGAMAQLAKSAEAITKLCTQPTMHSGLRAVATIMVLEGTSAVFIPWLRAAAKSAGVKDLTYFDIHGTADRAHAELFIDAFNEESFVLGYVPVEFAQDVLCFVNDIFQVHRNS